jgi:hypothetical protein
MTVELNDVEVPVLQDVLESYLSGLREEIYKTDTVEFKETLRNRESVLTSLLERLRRSA